ncbi:MAG: dihydroorotate dehydrogenase-like protein, partial [Bacteroidota bacterium]
MNTETSYLGIKLRNPVIVSSSGLSNSIEKIKQLEENGAGAIVLKSLFEEQITYDAGTLSKGTDYPEAMDYVDYYIKNNSVENYLKLIRQAKEEVSIPIFASINCVSSKQWIEFAQRIEEAGADGLEVNVFVLPMDKNAKAEKYEKIYFDLAEKLNKKLSIPFAFKLGSHFTNLVGLVERLNALDVPGVVLFNRFYAPDIDTENLTFTSSEVFSKPSDIRQSLRWVGIISSKVEKIDISASTGVHDGNGVVKQILAGAESVQVCSTLYKNGFGQLQNILKELKEWMNKHSFDSIDEFRGKMSYKKIEDPVIYERSQFM